MIPEDSVDTGGGEDVSDALSTLHLIESVLGDGAADDTPEESRPNIELSMGTILDLLPAGYVVDKVSADRAREHMVPISVPDLFRQLAEGKGKVSLSVADLIFNVPATLLSGAAFSDRETVVSLPLPQVVAALDPEVLRSKTSGNVKDYDLVAIPDPFVRPDASDQVSAPGAKDLPPAAPLPPVPIVQPEPVPSPPPEPSVAPEEKPALPVAMPVDEPGDDDQDDAAGAEVAKEGTIATPEDATVPTCNDIDFDEPPGGVNLNTANETQLRSLNGVSPAVAQMILSYRDAHGGFESIFDLYKLPRLGRKTFKKITGMPYSEKRLHRRRKLSRLLGIPEARVTHLPTVASSIAAEFGTAGCILSDNDGMMLAESGAPEYAESLSAVIPLLMTHVSETLDITGLRGVTAASICVAGEMLTSVVSGDIYVTLIRGDKRLARLQLSFIERVAKELAWLLSHRGYVGR